MIRLRHRSVPAFAAPSILLCTLLGATAALPAQRLNADGPAISPFHGLRAVEGGLEAQVGGDATWYPLVAVDAVATADLLHQSKQLCGDNWWKRITEDLPALMSAMGHPMERTADLTVLDPATGKKRVLEDVAMTRENRSRLKNHYRGRPPELVAPMASFGIAEVHADVAELRALLDTQFVYRHLREVDVDTWVRDAFARLSKGKVSRAALATEIDALMRRFGDGHSRVASRMTGYDGDWSSFLVQKVRGGYAAFHDRRTLLDPAHPYVVAIDGVPIERWLAASRARAPQGSTAMIERNAERNLRRIDDLRRELGIPTDDEDIVVTLADAEGNTRTFETETESRKPMFGPWPRTEPAKLRADGTLPGNIGYLRIAQMGDSPELLDGIDRAMAKFRDTAGLVIDVRGNGGGTRDVLLRLFPYMMAEDEGPQVVNAARRIVARRDRDRTDLLADRFMVRIDDPELNAAQRASVDAFVTTFEPEWTPPGDSLSELHVLLIERATNPAAYAYDKPVRVLVDGSCFSATDIFLAAMKTRANVELFGTPSGGGSGRARRHTLTQSGIELRLSSMVSYQPDGRLFEGHGVTPDTIVEPIATDLVRDGTDTVLEAALASMR